MDVTPVSFESSSSRWMYSSPEHVWSTMRHVMGCARFDMVTQSAIQCMFGKPESINAFLLWAILEVRNHLFVCSLSLCFCLISPNIPMRFIGNFRSVSPSTRESPTLVDATTHFFIMVSHEAEFLDLSPHLNGCPIWRSKCAGARGGYVNPPIWPPRETSWVDLGFPPIYPSPERVDAWWRWLTRAPA